MDLNIRKMTNHLPSPELDTNNQPKKYMKYAKEFEYAGHMLPILINYMVIHHTLTY